MIEAGAAGVHFEDQLAAAKKCGHLGGKVVVPTGEFIQKLVAARLASDMMGVPTLVVARTDANSAACSRATRIRATGPSSREAGRPKDTSAWRADSPRRSLAAWPT